MTPIILTTEQASRLAEQLVNPRGNRIRIGVDQDGVKVDIGWGWTPGYGQPAGETGH